MIKKLIPVVLILLWVAEAHTQEQFYGLEELNDKSSQYVASGDLQRFMERSVRRDLDACATESHLNSAQRRTYFAAVPISIDNRNKSAFLVFPTRYCAAFFGAHAIAYWIVLEDRPNGYRLLYEGRSDALEPLDTYSHGKKDLRSHYGSTYIVLKFDGKRYRRVGSGEFPKNE